MVRINLEQVSIIMYSVQFLFYVLLKRHLVLISSFSSSELPFFVPALFEIFSVLMLFFSSLLLTIFKKYTQTCIMMMIKLNSDVWRKNNLRNRRNTVKKEEKIREHVAAFYWIISKCSMCTIYDFKLERSIYNTSTYL